MSYEFDLDVFWEDYGCHLEHHSMKKDLIQIVDDALLYDGWYLCPLRFCEYAVYFACLISFAAGREQGAFDMQKGLLCKEVLQ